MQLGRPILEISEHIEHTAHLTGMMISIVVALAGILLAAAMYFYRKIDVEKVTQKMGVLYHLSYHKYYFDEIYQATFVKGLLLWNNILNWFDTHIIDGIVNGSAWITRNVSAISGKFDLSVIDGMVNEVADSVRDFGNSVRRIQTGQVQAYIFGALFGAILIIIINLI